VTYDAATHTSGQPAVTAAHEYEHVPGRPISWFGVAITCIGFVVGGIAFVPHPTWWLFWTGTGIAVAGLFVLLFAKTFSKDWY